MAQRRPLVAVHRLLPHFLVFYHSISVILWFYAQAQLLYKD